MHGKMKLLCTVDLIDLIEIAAARYYMAAREASVSFRSTSNQATIVQQFEYRLHLCIRGKCSTRNLRCNIAQRRHALLKSSRALRTAHSAATDLLQYGGYCSL